jgi:hypothetical protein
MAVCKNRRFCKKYCKIGIFAKIGILEFSRKTPIFVKIVFFAKIGVFHEKYLKSAFLRKMLKNWRFWQILELFAKN